MRTLVEEILSIERYPMYRRSIMMEQPQQEHFISRLGSLPVVQSAWTQASDLYQRTKESHGLIKATCNLAEGGVQTVYSSTKPLLDKYQPQIATVDGYACQKLAEFEEQYPLITRPTGEVIKESKEKCAAVVQPVTDRVNAVCNTYKGIVAKSHATVEATKETVKDYSLTTVNRTLESPVGRYAMDKLNEALTVSEVYVEKYLPPGEEEKEADMTPKEVDEVSTMTRVTSLSNKLRQRMYKRAMRDLKGLQVRSKEKLEGLTFTIDLIQYAKLGAQEAREQVGEKYELAQHRVVDLWNQINSDEEDEDTSDETIERKTIVVARRLTRNIKQSVSTVSGYLPTKFQPAAVKERLENALKYSEELYESFRKAEGFQDLPGWVLTQAREKMSYVQETVTFLMDTFLVSPISWLTKNNEVVPAIEGEEEMEEMVPQPMMMDNQ